MAGRRRHARPDVTAPALACPAAALSVAVIVPAFGQSGLLAEALTTALAQQGVDVRIVVVVDGCPLPETSRIALAFASAHPGRVFVLSQPNGGLSAARNTGIRFILAALPGCGLVHFLDADNRLHPHYLARAAAALDAAPATIGWVYPDIDAFGWPQNVRLGGPFSVLGQMFYNYADAGSVLRRALPEAGLRFDETLREGFEDWDFWLRAISAGWRGQHLPFAGFRYRRRPDSMRTQAERKAAQIQARLRERHQALFAPRSLRVLEAQEAPRFAIHAGDGYRVTSDPAAPSQTLTDAEAARTLLLAQTYPGSDTAPPYWIFADPACLDLLRDLGLLHGVLLRLLRSLPASGGIGLTVQGGDAESITLRPATATKAALLLLSATALVNTVATIPPPLLSLTIPAALLPPLPPAAPILAAQQAALRQAMQGSSRMAPDWRREFRPIRQSLAARADALHGIRHSLPLAPRDDRRDIAFLLPLLSFGGAERVMLNYAATFRAQGGAQGWRTHVVVLQADSITLTPALRQAVDHIHIAADLCAGATWEAPGYFGTPLEALAEQPQASDLIGLLAGMDVVVATNTPVAHGVAGRLRALGVRSYVLLHQMEQTHGGMPLGQAHALLGHEYGHDGVLVISEHLHAHCIGLGFPAGKLHLVRNAPAYATTPERIATAMAARQRRGDARLRALFIGRLDYQKGVERLWRIIAATRDICDWRVIGAAVLDPVTMHGAGITVEPPVHDDAALDAAYGWADVVVLPSRYEGVPLSLLEAQRLGAVPIATRVGAVDEIITDGADGLLVDPAQPDAAISAAFVEKLRQLAADRAGLLRLATAATARAAAADWTAHLTPFLRHLEDSLRQDHTPCPC